MPRHHIIDPATQLPAETDLLTVTVVASDAVQADVHATVAMQLGMENGYEHLARLSDVHGLLVRNDRSVAATPRFDKYLFNDPGCPHRRHR